MKVFYRATVLFVLIALLLTACASPPPAPGSNGAQTGTGDETSASDSQGEIILNMWGFEGETEFLPELFKRFEAENPGIKVQLTEIPESDFVTKMDTAMLAGEGPDIAFVYVPRWIKAGKFVSLNTVIEEHNIPFDDYNVGAITRDCVYEGQVYCLGTYTGAIVMVYNKGLFDEAGIPYPSATEPMSMKDYYDMTLQLTKQSDNLEERVWGGDAQPHTWWMDWRTHISSDGRQIKGYIDDEATVQAYQLMADMRKAGSAMSSADSALVQMEGPDMLVQGKLATTITDNIIVIPAVEAAGINWGTAIVPTEIGGDQSWTTTWTDGYGVLSTSRNMEAALKFIAFVGTSGNELRLELGYMPLNMKLAEQWVMESEGRQQAYDAISHARENLFVPGYWEATGLIWDAWTLMVDEDAPAQEAIGEVIDQMQEILDQTWETFDTGAAPE